MSEIMWLYPDARTALFIDGPNFHNSAKDMGFDVEYSTLLRFFRERSRLSRAFYYTAVDPSGENTPLRRLLDWLSYNGYQVVSKASKEFRDNGGQRRVKGNMDIELAIDMLNMAPYLDHVVLFSGDGDFRRLIEATQMRGIQVSVVASDDVTADEVQRQADQFVDLSLLRPYIERNIPGQGSNPGQGPED
jgi:uncharacterized LabA/DUF88 family protein